MVHFTQFNNARKGYTDSSTMEYMYKFLYQIRDKKT